ncbi:MAG: hypothetical protein EBX64_03525, partial [Betaproteobacteria bacterium]|nr:hypothetical protein [Betaproteobacteria bacterium]
LAEEDGGADLSLAELLPILGRLAFHALAVPMVETAVALALSRRADFLPAGWLYDQPLTLGLMDSQGRLQGLAYGPHCKAALVALGSGHEASLAWLDLPSDSAGLERGGLSPATRLAATAPLPPTPANCVRHAKAQPDRPRQSRPGLLARPLPNRSYSPQRQYRPNANTDPRQIQPLTRIQA